MSARVEAGADVSGGRVGIMGRMQAQLADSLRNGSEEARAGLERICARLDEIRDALNSLAGAESERTTYAKTVAANGTERLSEGRPGFIETIERIAVTADAATTVDVFVGSASDLGFRERLTFAAAGRDAEAPLAPIDVPEGSPIYVVAGAGAAKVNLQIKRRHV